ncbi:unnamed protein product [Protopolystoma xenopodis]|uniref:Uncharacterized protein n=1 Tax=Protopolystoma xenopodis TaxID=117903 RepID=A0A448WKQ0_9PLAT|nr:unnamed protein product [Protopolystoma xenopodis]
MQRSRLDLYITAGLHTLPFTSNHLFVPTLVKRQAAIVPLALVGRHTPKLWPLSDIKHHKNVLFWNSTAMSTSMFCTEGLKATIN